MDVQQLRYFVSVCETMNYTRTSEKLFVSRQAVAQSIRQLEQEIGAKLVLLDNGRLVITPLGEKICEDAKEIIAEFEQFSGNVKRYVSNQKGNLRVLVGAAVLSNFPIDILPRFNTLYSDVMLSVTEADNKEMRSALDSHRVDVCLMGTADRYLKNYNKKLLIPQQLTVLVNRKNPLSQKEALTIANLKGQPMIGHGEAYDLHRFYVDSCHAAGFEPSFSMISTNVDVIMHLLRQNRTVCFGTRNMEPLEFAVSVPLILPEDLTFGIYAVTPKDKTTVPAKLLISFLSEHD